MKITKETDMTVEFEWYDVLEALTRYATQKNQGYKLKKNGINIVFSSNFQDAYVKGLAAPFKVILEKDLDKEV